VELRKNKECLTLAAWSLLPVIAITEHDRPRNEERVLQLGAAAYLLKPMDETLLVDAIRRVL
jgi:DNA-binding NarL/FixJ family response regulator